jgi:beta-galactosidase
LGPVLAEICEIARISSPLPPTARGKVELAVRSGEGGRFAFLINRGDDDVVLDDLGGMTGELEVAPSLSGVRVGDAGLRLGPRGVAVLRLGAAAVSERDDRR